MTDLPSFTIATLEAEPPLDVAAFSNDDGVALGMLAVEVIRQGGYNLAVRVVLRGDTVFQAKLGTSGPSNDPWLAGKAAAVLWAGEPSLLLRLRQEATGIPFEERTDVDHELLRAHGGSIPIRVRGEIVGTITTSGEPDVVDHSVSAESVRRYLADAVREA